MNCFNALKRAYPCRMRSLCTPVFTRWHWVMQQFNCYLNLGQRCGLLLNNIILSEMVKNDILHYVSQNSIYYRIHVICEWPKQMHTDDVSWWTNCLFTLANTCQWHSVASSEK